MPADLQDTGPDERSRSLQEILELGFAAADALNAPIYQIANKIATDQIIMDWVNTAPKETMKRESLWHEIQAHGRISDIMQTFVERARQKMMEQQEEGSVDRSLEEQGFGLEPGYGEKLDDEWKLQ